MIKKKDFSTGKSFFYPLVKNATFVIALFKTEVYVQYLPCCIIVKQF